MRQLHPLEGRIGIELRDPSLLQTALTHKSRWNERPNDSPGHNERLEFLGDAILGAVVAELLYRAHPGEDEGALTIMRAALVRQSTLAEWARRFHLDAHLLLSKGEEQRGGRQRPSLLASAFEAVVGAIYLSEGWLTVRAFLEPIVLGAASTLVPSTRDRNPKSELNYRSQAAFGQPASYRVVSVDGLEHSPIFTVEVHAGSRSPISAAGPNRQVAEQEAARQMLDLWEETPNEVEAS